MTEGILPEKFGEIGEGESTADHVFDGSVGGLGHSVELR